MAAKEEHDDFNIPEKVLRYEKFLNETLRKDLQAVLEERDKVYSKIAEYLQLKNVVDNIQQNKLENSELKTQVDLGCNFYVQAKVDDPSRIYVCVGYGFFVEFTLPEAMKFIDKKVAQLTESSEALTKDASKIKANIKLVIEGLREIQHIDDKGPEKLYRDIFS